jgi:hypothetical protein
MSSLPDIDYVNNKLNSQPARTITRIARWTDDNDDVFLVQVDDQPERISQRVHQFFAIGGGTLSESYNNILIRSGDCMNLKYEW